MTRLVASTQKDLQNLTDNLSRVTKKYGTKLNVKQSGHVYVMQMKS